MKLNYTITLLLSALFTSISAQETTKIEVSADAYVRAGRFASRNYGTSTTNYVKKPSTNQNFLRKTALKFDVRSIENVGSAKLYFYAKAQAAIDVTIGTASNDSWSETAINYNNLPISASRTHVTLPLTYQWVSVDVTNILLAEVANSNGLMTMVLTDEGNTNKTAFIRSKEYSSGQFAPYLEITENAEQPEEESRDIYLVIGQSNTAGRGLLEAQDNVTLDGVDILNANGNWEAAAGGMNRYSTIKKATAYQGVNYSYTFGKTINQLTGRRVGIVCNAQGGTNISQWAVSSSNGFYDEAVARTKQALAAGGTLKGILWHQGEANRNSTSTYLNNLNAIVSALRAEFGNVPFIAGQLSQDRDDTNNDNFNRMLEAISNTISNSSYVSSDGLTTNAEGLESGSETDETHYDNYSQRVLGRRYASRVLELVYGQTINTAVIPVQEDSYIRAGSNAARSYPNDALVRIKELGGSNRNTRRGVIKFNTSGFSGQVVDASMIIDGDVRSGSGVIEVGMYEYNDSWTEGSVTFSNGSSFGDKINTHTFRGTTKVTSTIPVADYFAKSYADGSVSLAMQGDHVGQEQYRFRSSENGISVKKPYILVSYIGESTSVAGDAIELQRVSSQRASDVTVYPNPVLNYLTVNATSNISTVKIAHFNGVVTRNFAASGNIYTVDFTDLPSGYYEVSVELVNGDVQNTTIVKN